MTTKPKHRNVKSMAAVTTDAHERRKDFLTQTELERFLAAARDGRHGIRDHAIAFVTVRHGLRVSELVDLRLSDLLLDDPRSAQINVHRLKGSLHGMHPIEGDELRALKAHLRLRPANTGYDAVFLNERDQPFSRQGINYLFAVIARRAELPHVNPHMLRHTCGYLLADQDSPFRTIQDYLGHRQPANTVRYTRISSAKFCGLFRRKGTA